MDSYRNTVTMRLKVSNAFIQLLKCDISIPFYKMVFYQHLCKLVCMFLSMSKSVGMYFGSSGEFFA